MKNTLYGMFILWISMLIAAISFASYPMIYTKIYEIDGDVWYVGLVSALPLITGMIWSIIIGLRGTYMLKTGGVSDTPGTEANGTEKHDQ